MNYTTLSFLIYYYSSTSLYFPCVSKYIFSEHEQIKRLHDSCLHLNLHQCFLNKVLVVLICYLLQKS